MEKFSSAKSTAKPTPREILANFEETAKRIRFMYWVPDHTLEAGGYYKLVKTQEEVPNGTPFQECIVMG